LGSPCRNDIANSAEYGFWSICSKERMKKIKKLNDELLESISIYKR